MTITKDDLETILTCAFMEQVNPKLQHDLCDFKTEVLYFSNDHYEKCRYDGLVRFNRDWDCVQFLIYIDDRIQYIELGKCLEATQHEVHIELPIMGGGS